jgi:hypothetical protein
MIQCDQVFGVSTNILKDSYVDRGNLDEEIDLYLRRDNHIALRGASKSGKSWLRKRKIPNAIVVQCRFKTTTVDVFTDALSQLGIKLVVSESTKDTIKGKVEATAQAGFDLIAKIKVKLGLESSQEDFVQGQRVGHDINDLRFISDILKESGKRLVIEDFHYLSVKERTQFSSDLKAMWDYGCYVVIIGVWTSSNLLIALNDDLTDRVVELPVDWNDEELKYVIEKGSSVLRLDFSDQLKKMFVQNCYKNVGLLQKLVLTFLDKSEIYLEQEEKTLLDSIDKFETAAMTHAEQLDTRYQQFAKDVSTGIRKRKNTTGIYAYAMAIIVESDDSSLLNGLPLEDIFQAAVKRQPRIQKSNLRLVLQKLEQLQVDADGRNLVIAFDESNDEVSVIDRRLLFYRKYITISWPWEQLIKEFSNEIGSESVIVSS